MGEKTNRDMAPSRGAASGPELVGKTVAFLKQRDGLDKVLKLAKYLSSLGVELKKEDGRKLRDLESALSLSRKAFRLGKFLGNVSKLQELRRKEEKAREERAKAKGDAKEGGGAGAATYRDMVEENYFLSRRAYLLLSMVSNSSEGVYYFLDQLQFLVKAKVLRKSETMRAVKKFAAVAEILSYLADTLLIVLDGKQSEMVDAVQNVADFFLALNDLREKDTALGDPRFLACLGLCSAVIGIKNKWKQ